MSDTYSGESQLVAPASRLTATPSALAAPSLLAPSVDQIDRNFRRVTQLEQATRLPALPDLVKFDLIQADGADEDSLTEMLLGLDDAYARRVESSPQLGAAEPTSVPEPGQPGTDQTRIIVAALSGNPAPRRTSSDATKAFKLRAIERGMLDMDPRQVDNTWSPEFNRLRGEMAFDDYNRQLRGDHPGATTFNRAMSLIGEFTSPAGLLHMATELDMFWDFGAIGHEISTWGDKWRQVGKSKNPLDFGKNLIDALTGPIDDIVFPVVNDALMFTGLGAIANSARVGWQGARLVETGGMFSRLFEGGGTLGRFYDAIGSGVGRNLLEMREPGLIARRLQRGSGLVEDVGDAMAAWRNLTPVVASKQIMQTGMRLGFAAAVENRFPGYNSDGLSVSDLPGGAQIGNALQNTEEALARGAMGALGTNTAGIVTAGVVTTGLELMFAPYNIFSPGTFFRHGTEGLGLLSGTGRQVTGALGTIPGRAIAGAGVGAVAGAIGGDSTAATVEGAVAGAAVGAAAPALGALLENQRIRQAAIGAFIAGGTGAMLGEDPRAAALTGAIAGVGMAYLPANVRRAVFEQAGIHGVDQLLQGVGHRMVRTSFQMIERDQHVQVGWYNTIRRSLLNDPEQLADWDARVRQSGVIQAWADKMYGGEREVAAAEMVWMYSHAAVTWIAERQAAAVQGGRDILDLARNKLVSQLRPINIDRARPVEDVVHDVASRLAWQEHGGVAGDAFKVRDHARQRIAELMENPEQAYKMAEEHNKAAGATIAQLWDPRNFPNEEFVPLRARTGGMDEWGRQSWNSRQDVFETYAGDSLEQIGSFGKFTAASNDIRMARSAGLFDDMTLAPVVDRYGRTVDVETMKVPPRDPKATAVNDSIGDLLAGGEVDPARVPGVTPLASAHEAGRVTVMRGDELTKQEVREWSERVADVVDTARHLSDAQGRNWSSVLDLAAMDDAFAAARISGDTVADRQLVEMAQAAAKRGVNRKSIKRLLAFSKRHKIGPASLDSTIRRMTDDLLNDTAWAERGFGRVAKDENGRYLEGMDALEYRLKQLRDKEPHTAAEVDVDGMIGRAEAAESTEFAGRVRQAHAPRQHGETGLSATAVDAMTPEEYRFVLQHAASVQRDVPEKVMHDVQRATGGGAYSTLAEHIGDITHRLNDEPSLAQELTAPKVNRAIGTLRNQADLKDMGRTVGEISPTAQQYAAAHRQVPVYNRPSYLGREAAVALGEGNFNQALMHLQELRQILDDPEEFRRLMSQQGSVEFLGGSEFAAQVQVKQSSGHSTSSLTQSQQLRQLRDGLAERGYKLVHGVQFVMPEDLTFNTPTFHDITRRHMNAVTHGNWFGRRLPIEARILDDRRRRGALVDELSKVGTDLSPEDDQITNILQGLEESLRREQDDVARSLNEAHVQNKPKLVQTLERVKSSWTPIRIDDLGGVRRGTPERVRQALAGLNLSADEEQAVVRAINRFRNTDFHDMGLFAIESYLRGKSAPAGVLKMLGGTKYGGRVTGTVRQAATGALVGGALGAATAGGDASFEDRLKAALGTAAVGAAAGAGLALGVSAADRPGGIINAISGKQGVIGGAALGAVGGAVAGGEDGRLEGALLGGVGGAVAGGLAGTGNIIQRAEDWRYGYLVDGYARLRDSMRFTLSPFFDLSRYTEGMFLSQTAIPLRDAAGHRIVVPLNASPRGLRSRIAKQLTRDADAAGETLSSVEAGERATNKYNAWMGEFQSAARGAKDFDYDAIDSTGQWFRQVGMLGFSPTDWMATAYANLRNTGMGSEQAYHAAREMYQYGTRGRSAAELSVNFIFFPFSFQKKALTHIGKWMNDDLGRSIMIHDALKTYETLDQRYDLDNYWREHIPFLQQLGRLNLFAYGLSPGRLGGINAQALEGLGKVALNAFLPVGAKIADASAGKELQDVVHQLLPVLNDINWMSHDVSEVVMPELRAGAQRIKGTETPMAFESEQAQVSDGWAEFNAYKTDFEASLASEGYTTNDVMGGRNDWLLPLKEEYDRKINEIATRYPAWWASRLDSPGNAIAIDMEKTQRINSANFAVQDGRQPSVDDMQVAQMQAYIDDLGQQMELATGSTSLDDAPPEMWDAIHQMAAQLADQNPHFIPLWRKFWQRQFGLIDIPMELNG